MSNFASTVRQYHLECIVKYLQFCSAVVVIKENAITTIEYLKKNTEYCTFHPVVRGGAGGEQYKNPQSTTGCLTRLWPVGPANFCCYCSWAGREENKHFIDLILVILHAYGSLGLSIIVSSAIILYVFVVDVVVVVVIVTEGRGR